MPLPDSIPLVDYLVLGDAPHLVAQECRSCGARYFNRRSGCASCFGVAFDTVDIATIGILQTFTIVSFAAEGVPVPFVAGVIDCGGTPVPGNIINVDPTEEDVQLSMPVRLATYSIGIDAEGTEAIAYGFEPVDTQPTNGAH